MTADDPVDAYDRDAVALARQYENLSSEAILGPCLALLPDGRGRLALDVGAGGGRDGAFLAARGFQVVAVEPSAGMRAEGRRRHPHLRWIDDRLPALDQAHRLGLSYDLILLSAVWMHVAPGARARAFRKLVALLKPGGLMLMSLRRGPSPADRPMHPTPFGDIEALARDHGLVVVQAVERPDLQRRPDVAWTLVALQLPDDGSASLPLIRGVILNDDKSSTYKLGLLRAVAKVADTAPGLARPDPEADRVHIPMGLVALNWLRAYLPLVKADAPQTPGNRGGDGLGFAKAGFRALIDLEVGPADLRIGAAFTEARAAALIAALSDARATIVRMPMRHITLPHAHTPVFSATRPTGRPAGAVFVDAAFLARWGDLVVPGPLWRALQRLGTWIDPVLTAEWARLSRRYAAAQGRSFAPGVLEALMTWQEPSRDVALARRAALSLVAGGERVACVWSGARLAPDSLDIDHALPWSAWPCGDLWNLFPAARRVNQHDKRDRLPSAAALAEVRDAVGQWWTAAWMDDPALAARFAAEARAALPIEPAASLEAVFAGLEWRRLRIQQDQNPPQWAGPAGRRRPSTEDAPGA